MLYVQVMVNGTPIELITARNCEELADGKYRYEVTACGKRMEVLHKRSEGWEPLVIKILKRLQKSDKVDFSGE